MEVTQKNNLETLRILHLVMAAMSIIGSVFAMAYVFLFFNFFDKVSVQQPEMQEMPIEIFSMVKVIFIGIGLFVIVIAILNLLIAKYLKERKNKTFIIVASVVNCFTGILGILLGVFTIVEVNKDYAKPLFESKEVS